jgi:hypothetical protein
MGRSGGDHAIAAPDPRDGARICRRVPPEHPAESEAAGQHKLVTAGELLNNSEDDPTADLVRLVLGSAHAADPDQMCQFCAREPLSMPSSSRQLRKVTRSATMHKHTATSRTPAWPSALLFICPRAMPGQQVDERTDLYSLCAADWPSALHERRIIKLRRSLRTRANISRLAAWQAAAA